MGNSDITRRLNWHAWAGLLESEPVTSAPSISDCLALGSEARGRLDEALSDLIDALSQLNHELNGPNPSGPLWPERRDAVSREHAYAIAVLTEMLRKCAAKEDDLSLRDAAWRIDTAWSAVLAGDIDDLEQHIQHEARALSPWKGRL